MKELTEHHEIHDFLNEYSFLPKDMSEARCISIKNGGFDKKYVVVVRETKRKFSVNGKTGDYMLKKYLSKFTNKYEDKAVWVYKRKSLSNEIVRIRYKPTVELTERTTVWEPCNCIGH